MKITSDKVLIANPFVKDIDFYQSVVLILEHSSSGTLGMRLNHPSLHYFGNVIFEEFNETIKIPMLSGGPLKKEVKSILHTSKKISKTKKKVLKGTYLDTDRNIIPSIISNRIPFYVYEGYCIWKEHQLEQEIENSNWLMSTANKNFIFSTKISNMWRQALSNLGGLNEYYAKYVKHPYYH